MARRGMTYSPTIGQTYQPPTFEERGAVIPFTTPALIGGRLRIGERGGTELLMPNPSGGAGVYVLSWDRACTMCHPTIHDLRLSEHLQRLSVVTPATIRGAARAVLIEGLSGRDAQAAAIESDAAEARTKDAIVVQMMTALLNSRELAALGASEPAGMARLTAFVPAIAARLRMQAGLIVPALEQLADAFLAVGLGGEASPPRVPGLLDRLGWVLRDTSAWSRAGHGRSSELAFLIADAAVVTGKLVTGLLQDARQLTGDVPALLRLWVAQPDRVARLAGRPEWLLDGWERICLLWEDAVSAQMRPLTLAEMAPLIPTLPREMKERERALGRPERPPIHHRAELRDARAPSGASMLQRVARNERFRTSSA